MSSQITDTMLTCLKLPKKQILRNKNCEDWFTAGTSENVKIFNLFYFSTVHITIIFLKFVFEVYNIDDSTSKQKKFNDFRYKFGYEDMYECYSCLTAKQWAETFYDAQNRENHK